MVRVGFMSCFLVPKKGTISLYDGRGLAYIAYECHQVPHGTAGLETKGFGPLSRQ